MSYVEKTVVGPQMCFFQNTHGVAFFQRLNIDKFMSYGEYFKAVLTHPLDIISIWFSHLFFGLDLKFPWLYNLELKPAGVLYSLANYTVIYLVLRSLLKRKWSRQTWVRNTIGVLILVIPSMIALMVNMEERFMMPVHMIIYMVAAYSVSLQSWALGKPKIRWGELVVYAGFVVFCFAYSARILSALSLTLQ